MRPTRLCSSSLLLAIALLCWGLRSAGAEEPDFPAELVAFHEGPVNPVFTGAGDGAWDARIRERGWILREGDLWRMWYTGYDGTPDGPMKLGYAMSADGIKWTRYPGNPIYDKHWVEDMMIVPHDGTYYMFAEGLHDRAQLLTSPDGIEWTRRGQLDIRMKDGMPIEEGPYGTPTAWLEEGVWRLFYERRDLGVWLATSQDLDVWTNVQDEPVLTPGPEEYDRDLIALNQIVRHNGHYYGYYHGTSTLHDPRLWTTNVAVSDDLVHWTKYAGNPLFPEATNKSSGILVPDGDGFRLYTMHNEVRAHFAD
jgi:beta-1,2-mannobiose phosphorylase / 1,2-beta-oligomannan phosphorylase